MADQMGSMTKVLKPSAAKTANGAGNEIVIPMGFRSVKFVLDVTAASGTSPTLDVYLQDGMHFAAATDLEGRFATGTLTWNDYCHFTQMTTTGTRYIGIVPESAFEAAAQDAALAAGSVRAGPAGQSWRVKWVIAGTNPSFTFSVVGEFRP